MEQTSWLNSPPLTSGLDSEGGRAFLQQRIALFAKLTSLISVVFFVVSGVLLSTVGWHSWQSCWDRQFWLGVATLILLFLWLITRRGQLARRTLVVLDGSCSLLAIVAYGLMTTGGEGHLLTRMDLEMMQIAIILLLVRAVIIPSVAWHTATVTLLGMLPVVAVSLYVAVASSAATTTPPLIVASVMASMWGASVVAMTTLISRVIYRLRAKVRAAERLGQYVLTEKIGEGGMGAVYRAEHALLRRPTAIKLILPERAGMSALVRFEREVQLTAMLTHPNTVSIFDYGRTPDRVFYYAMEYLEGINLEQLVQGFGPQPPERVVHILIQLCGALTEAHEMGLVHRDVKPANVILCERGHILDTAKIVDFGLVKRLTGVGADPKLSQINSIMGTPHYLAPEALIAPDSVDARADLYALGGVAYFLLCGHTVFEGATVMEICAQHLHSEPLPPSGRCGLPMPPGLDELVLRCLAKDPEGRPSSAAALAAELAELGLPAWSQAQARAWWRDHAGKLPRRALPHAPGSAIGPTVAVDLAARAVLR